MAEHMCQYKGKPLFEEYVTATNDYGNNRIQFLVTSDAHKQMEAAFEGFNKAKDENGYPSLQLVSTGNPTRDKVYLVKKLTTFRVHQNIRRDWMHLFHNHLLLQLNNCHVMDSIK